MAGEVLGYTYGELEGRTVDRHHNISLYTYMKFLKVKDTFKCSIVSLFLLDSSFIEMEAID